MCKYIIEGGRKLFGEIDIQGSKNAVLPILAATLINNGISTIKNCPSLRDVDVMLNIMTNLGCKVVQTGDTIVVDSSNITGHEIPVAMAAEMRSSIIFLGPLLARMGKVTIAYPGGCGILLSQEFLLHGGY